MDSDAVAPAVKDAVSRGIKVISVDRGVNGVDVDCAIASDNVEGAKMATEYMVSLLGENAKVAEQVTVPEEVWLINRLQSVDGIKDIVPVTKDNDPNGMLNKEDGYVSCVYFSYDRVDNSSVPGENVIDKGTDCGGAVEIYGTLQAAQNRVSYLAGFDNTILYSGSYAIVGTMVIRTSYLLTDEEQYNLTDAITRAVTKIE